MGCGRPGNTLDQSKSTQNQNLLLAKPPVPPYNNQRHIMSGIVSFISELLEETLLPTVAYAEEEVEVSLEPRIVLEWRLCRC